MYEIPLNQDENSHSPSHLYRCVNCHRLVSMTGFLEAGICSGHQVRYARHLSPLEWVRWKLGLIPYQEGGLWTWLKSWRSPRKTG